MSKSTIQNWNAKSQNRNPKCQGVMQFGMQNLSQRPKQPVCNAESKSVIQTVHNSTLECKKSKPESKMSRRNAVCNAKIEIRHPDSQFVMQNRNQ